MLRVMGSKVVAEWHPLEEVVVHRPGIEMFFGLLEPFSFLYERTFSMDEAIFEHMNLEHTLEAEGVRVHRLKRLAIRLIREHREMADKVRNKALHMVKFRGPRGVARKAEREFAAGLNELDPETLFNIMILRPSISLVRGKDERTVYPRPTLDVPLANLVFMRDQQAVTDRGIAVGRMSKPQRRMEPLITSTVLEMAGKEVACEVKAPGTFEGGDFIPAGEFAMIGIGDRTNRSGVNQVLRSGIDFYEVAVVHQPLHPLVPENEPDPMVNMHLDTYLNLAGPDIAVGCETLLRRAKVEVYRRSPDGSYTKNANTILYDYLRAKGFSIVPVTTLEQMCYASNFLCLRDRRILAVEVEKVVPKVLNKLARTASENPHRYHALLMQTQNEYTELRQSGRFFPRKKEFDELGVEAVTVQLQEITGGYGGAHCMTCVLERRPV